MLRDDRRGDHRRDEKKDHKDRDRKRKHEAPTLLILFNIFLHRFFGCHLGNTVCFPRSCWNATPCSGGRGECQWRPEGPAARNSDVLLQPLVFVHSLEQTTWYHWSVARNWANGDAVWYSMILDLSRFGHKPIIYRTVLTAWRLWFSFHPDWLPRKAHPINNKGSWNRFSQPSTVVWKAAQSLLEKSMKTAMGQMNEEKSSSNESKTSGSLALTDHVFWHLSHLSV